MATPPMSPDSSFSQKSPLSASSPYSYKSLTTLEQRVNEFDKTAKYMVKVLEKTKEKIQKCEEEPSVIEHIKLSVAPDAATLISQGDTLILETHGKSPVLSQRLIMTQASLRDAYKEVQNTRITRNGNVVDSSIFLKSQNVHPENQYSPKEKFYTDKKFPASLLSASASKHIQLDDLAEKVLKRTRDLIAKPVDMQSEDELTRRILDIGVSRKDFFFVELAIVPDFAKTGIPVLPM